MGFLAKLISQILLLVLPKLINDVVDYFRKKKELKKLEEENKKKGDAYENAPTDSASDDFSKLP